MTGYTVASREGRAPTAAPLRVLVVEDRAEDAELIVLALRRGGFDPSWERADSADGLRAALAAGTWDAVLSDYTLPGFGARAALGVVREADPDLPFLVVSGTVGEEVAVEVMRAGANDFVLKHALSRLAPAVGREVREAARRRAGRRAEEAVAHLAALVESSADGIVSLTPDGVIKTWNPAAERLFGYPAAEAVGRPVSLLVPPEKAGELGRVMDRVRRGGAGETFETVRVRKGGARIDVAVTISPVLGPGGGVAGACKVVRDITDRRHAEEALRLSEERHRRVVQDQTEVVCRFRADGTITFVNEVYCRVFGKAPGELLGGRWQPLAHPDDRDRIEARLAGMSAADPVVVVENRVTDGAGRVRWMEFVNRGFYDPDGRLAEVQAVGRDVTERKTAETALRESEERYRTLIAATAAIVWTTPASGEFGTDQPGWAAFTGQGFDQSRGWGWLDAIHPDDRADTARGWSAALGGRTAYEVEHRLRRADGEYRWMSVRAVPILGRDGAIREWVGVHTDVHRHRQAEIDRGNLLARTNLQIERMPLGYLLTDADFRYTRWNPAAERTFGFAEAEVLGRHPSGVIVPPQSRPAVDELLDRLRAGDMDAHGTYECVTRDGRAIVCEWYTTPLFDPDGTFQGALFLTHDVTARRQAEHALLLRDRAIQAVNGGLVITDHTRPDHPIIYASPGFERLTGYAGAEVLGRNCRFLQGPGTDPQALAAVREALRVGRPCDVELLNYRKDGTPFWNQLLLSPIRDAAGRLTHFVGVQTDVTGRRRLEDQFRQAQKMEAVGRLAGGVAHDFNNLLTIINGYSEVVGRELPADHPAQELLAEITRAGDRAAGLTRQLLAFSRQTLLEPKVLEPNALVRDLERMLRRLIGEDIDLTTRLAPSLGRVRADPGQLEQAIVNLCVNARDAMPRGGLLTVETRNADLDAADAAAHADVRPGRYVVLSVADTGCGMTDEVRARIFEPFFTTKGVGKGTGLGLAMVFGFVKQSGGHVEVQSEPGRGSTFRLYLPRVGGAPAAGKSGLRLASMPRGTETVLLVEDEEAVRALGRHVLRQCGYTVLDAGNGREAAGVAAGHPGPLHLLLTDVVMPGGVGGRQVAEAVLARHPGAKVLFTSGYTDDTVVRHGVLENGTHFLQKPFSPAALAQKVRDVLDGSG
ncbi:MAG: hybrid sensor histidine kinase/response regulator [Isosphaera sp.]|nr:hybrid sensor histidine kinase/response regulator [Isosphaera sp.]